MSISMSGWRSKNSPARPLRPVVDFLGDGAAEATEVAERVRTEFARREGE